MLQKAQQGQLTQPASQYPAVYRPALSSCATPVKYGTAEGPIRSAVSHHSGCQQQHTR